MRVRFWLGHPIPKCKYFSISVDKESLTEGTTEDLVGPQELEMNLFFGPKS